MACHNPIDDLDIQALVDNQLGEDEAKRVRFLMAGAPQLLKRYSELLQQKKLLQAWWLDQAQAEAVPARAVSSDRFVAAEEAGAEALEDKEDEEETDDDSGSMLLALAALAPH